MMKKEIEIAKQGNESRPAHFSSYPTPKITASSVVFRPGAGWVFSLKSYSTLKNKFL